MTPPNNAPPSDAPRKLRWYQYSLRGLIGVMTLCAVLAFAYSRYLRPYEQQQATVELVQKLGGTCQTVEAQEWWLTWFGTRQHVTQVILADCDEPDQYVDAVRFLPKLELLIVGGLKFTDDHAAALHRLKSLKGLILDSTIVSDEAVAALREALPAADVYQSQRRAIRELTRGNSEFIKRKVNTSHLALQELAGDEWMSEASDLAVHKEVTDSGLAHLRCLSQLRHLVLERTRVTDAGLVHLRGLSHVHSLDLTGTQVAGAGLVHLRDLSLLQALHLHTTKVTDAALAHLVCLNQLQTLNLCSTRVTDAGLVHLSGLHKLQDLILFDTRVTDAGLVHLRDLSNLQTLSLIHTQVTGAGVAKLKRALPTCRIYYP